MRRTFLALATALLCLLAGFHPALAGRVPAMTAYDLNGRELRVPQDLAGAPSLWIVAFEREQQPEIERVLTLVRRARVQGLVAWGLVAWEVPVIQDPGAIVRFVIDQGMKSGIPSEAKRARVVTLYVASLAQWRGATGLSGASGAVAAVVASDGRVLAWRPVSQISDADGLRSLLAAAP